MNLIFTKLIFHERDRYNFCNRNLSASGSGAWFSVGYGVIARIIMGHRRRNTNTNPSRKRSFPKALLKPENLTTLALRFRLERKLFENEAFRKRQGLIIMWFSWSSCTQTLIQNDRWLLHLNFFSVVVWPEFFLCAAFPEAKSVRPPDEA